MAGRMNNRPALTRVPRMPYPNIALPHMAIANSNAQADVGIRFNHAACAYPSEFKTSFIPATANLRWTRPQNVMIGGEFQWAQRRNFSDGWIFNDYRVEFSFKYSFSYTLGR